VWLVCRSEARGREAQKELLPHSPGGRVFLEQLDLSDLAAVRAFAGRFPPERVDVLVHNAGMIPEKRVETRDGLELTMATHVVGPYLLSQLLEPRLRAARAARVIFVSSGGMYTQKLSLEDLAWTTRPYDGVAAYAQTKRMQVVLAELLAEQWRGSGITCHSMHPGWADTPGVESSLPNFWKHMEGRLRSPAEGADTALWLAVAAEPDRSSGGFWFDRARVSPYYVPFTRESAAQRRALLEFVDKASGRSATP
jgi:NAD(P)-dependent dehydrogenase (short-subunit alcohol dehydrogenase family)